jgi:uncharacterized protein YbjT (DUF2867 family)
MVCERVLAQARQPIDNLGHVILVTGASGRIGVHLVRRLCASGHPVRVLVRSPERTHPFAGLKVETAIGDFEVPDTLPPAMQGVERLFLLSPVNPRLAELESGVISAAAEGGVRQVVKLSALGAAPDWPVPMPRWHWQAEQEIERSGLAWTHLRPTYFMQNLLGFAGPVAAGTLQLPLASARVAMVDVRDIAEVAARALAEDRHRGKVYELTGPAALGGRDLASGLAAVLGRSVTYVDQPEEEARAGMISAGVPGWLAENRLAAFRSYRASGLDGYASRVSGAVDEVTGRPAIHFPDFVVDYRAAFG